MVDDAHTLPSHRRWHWLMLLPWIALCAVPSYNRIEPQLLGLPFFYWYQLAWVPASAAITALVYIKTRARSPLCAPGADR
ncbi:DUF3311 domain-containing protein [Burkholderia sp. A1]|uniref:DUF3311 domain-containing protein n=1 Tax=Burkholderia sp. A1 TaxID=148446 RepID=UPI0004691428|nr:DUF3311 domain-containing protein [Burkholderia sp. A1]